MNRSAVELYLNLMKKTLTYTLWEEPGKPIDAFLSRQHAIKKAFVSTLSRALSAFGLQMVRKVRYSSEERLEGLIWPLYAHTMVGVKRLDNIQHCIESVLRESIEGDLIETGVWRGGASIFMKAVLTAHGATGRKLFVADSFCGLPRPDESKYPQDKGDKLYRHDFLAASKKEVENNFRKYDLLDDEVVFLEGWFRDTLPGAPIEKLSVMRLDGDMYESTMDALTNLYPKLSDGGYCIVDDYLLPTCKAAVDHFRSRRNIACTLEKIDRTGVFWRKTRESGEYRMP